MTQYIKYPEEVRMEAVARMANKIKGFWYCCGGSEGRRWVLLKHYKRMLQNFRSDDILGEVNRLNNGSWSCFHGDNFVGNEPTRRLAIRSVEHYVS